MKKILIISFLVFFIAGGSYLYLNFRDVKVIDAHHDQYTAQILVDHLPLSTSASIDWWVKNQAEILSRYKILPKESGGPAFLSVFSFGKGYQDDGYKDREDRLCFADMKPPKNCIDKDIIMLIYRTRNGDTQFRRHENTYLMTQDGKITEVSKD